MNQDQYQAVIVKGYLGVLSCLAMEFRGSAADSAKRTKIVHAYNSILELLIAFGWSDGLDPDTELPDELISEDYLQLLRGKPRIYASDKPTNG